MVPENCSHTRHKCIKIKAKFWRKHLAPWDAVLSGASTYKNTNCSGDPSQVSSQYIHTSFLSPRRPGQLYHHWCNNTVKLVTVSWHRRVCNNWVLCILEDKSHIYIICSLFFCTRENTLCKGQLPIILLLQIHWCSAYWLKAHSSLGRSWHWLPPPNFLPKRLVVLLSKATLEWQHSPL